MKIYSETNIKDFDFWSGAADTAKYLTDEDMDQIESMLEECNPDGMSETEVNDFFWFEDDTIAEWLGYESFEALMKRDEEEEEEETFFCPVCDTEWDDEEDILTCCDEDEDV